MQEEYDIYGGFASVYDKFMDNIPYDEWHQYLVKLLHEHGICDGIVVDLACGTGEMTRRLADSGYDMIGIDFSEDMLDIAREKCSSEVLLLGQDMRELDLYGTAKAMVCVCDGMNYLCSVDDLKKVFERVKVFLEPGGVFIFDMKTAYFYREVLGDRTMTENREYASYIWENQYDTKEKINEYLLTIYELVDDDKDLFVRTDEVHRQRAYNIEEVQNAARACGLSCIHVYEAFSKEAPKEDSQRLYFVVQRSVL